MLGEVFELGEVGAVGVALGVPGVGRLSRQGPAALRWALFEAALAATRNNSPDHTYYLQVKERLGAKRAYLSVARKLARRIHHILRGLGDLGFAQVT